uniref:Uncharacterized protein n=1 Tax=Salix viminalis TaxID=40686 RepID=A0A6N2N8W7_SALVM
MEIICARVSADQNHPQDRQNRIDGSSCRKTQRESRTVAKFGEGDFNTHEKERKKDYSPPENHAGVEDFAVPERSWTIRLLRGFRHFYSYLLR